MKEVYIFDFDGTLVDSMSKAVKVVLGYLTKHGVSYPDDIIRTLIPLGFTGIAKYYHEHFGIPQCPERILSDFQEELAHIYATEMEAKSGAEKTLKTLKERGARLFILTGSPHVFLDKCLYRLDLAQYFEACWTTEDLGLSKGDARIYGETAKRIGVPIADCVMVDDGVKALKKAHEAGMQTVGFYDSYSAENENEMCSFADKYIYNFEELL